MLFSRSGLVARFAGGEEEVKQLFIFRANNLKLRAQRASRNQEISASRRKKARSVFGSC
jgi:hypothetical protein